MSKDNTALILGVAILGYLYMKRQAVPVQYVQQPGGVPGQHTMPGSVGNGWQNVATGAVTGFLNSLINGPSNATSQSYFPSTADPLDAIRGGVLQESYVPDLDVAGWLGLA